MQSIGCAPSLTLNLCTTHTLVGLAFYFFVSSLEYGGGGWNGGTALVEGIISLPLQVLVTSIFTLLKLWGI